MLRFDVLAKACGAPWNYKQQALITSKKSTKQLLPSSGIECLAMQGPAPKSVPRPTSRRSDDAASDPSSSSRGDEDDDDNDDEDPREGSAGRDRAPPTRKRDELSQPWMRW